MLDYLNELESHEERETTECENISDYTHKFSVHLKSHKQAHLCGKLEELPEPDRHIYFPSSNTRPAMHIQGRPIFGIFYRLVDHCYNVTFVARNGSFELKSAGELQCTFKINLPYGNRVALKLLIGDSSVTSSPETSLNFQDFRNGDSTCEGLLTQLQDGASSWSHCTKSGDSERQIEIVSRENRVMLKVVVRNSNGDSDKSGTLGLKMSYRAEPVESVVGICEFGWVILRQFCVSAMEGVKLPWAQAEIECTRKGGHLASVRSDLDQQVLNNLLINSPGYRDHNAYWIGASDKTHEGDFKWADGLPFSYTNWFPGWEHDGHYNKQPNDDGLSEQDCVEVRRIYPLPTSSARLTTTFMWNDRDCSTPNYFICERLQNDEPLESSWTLNCNRSVILTRDQPKAFVSSPGFPRHYPDNANCDIDINATPGYRIILDFEELVLEKEPSCSYDFLQILENQPNDATPINNSLSTRRLCGDWSSKLKLLRYVSHSSRLKLRFSSDYSHHFGGFKARVSMENVMQCADDRYFMFNNSCYLIISYPEVTWNTSKQICEGMKSNLASVLSSEEERFITTSIRRTPEYRTNAFYWLGGLSNRSSNFQWIDGNPMKYSNWIPGQAPTENDLIRNIKEVTCLSVQWTATPIPTLPSGMYWKVHQCEERGGYICKKQHQLLDAIINYNKTLNGTEGTITSPNYPSYYFNNLDFSVRIIGPQKTRVIIKFVRIDIEFQLDCLYDYIELKSIYRNKKRLINDATQLCGSHERDLDRFNFVSETNEAEVVFHSDYSIAGKGFSLIWYAVDVSACPTQTLTSKEGVLMTPNYPDFLLAHLDCTVTIIAPAGKRIWLDFFPDDTDLIEVISGYEDFDLELILGKYTPTLKPFGAGGLLTEGSFISSDERLKMRIQTGDHPMGPGFRASYKIINPVRQEKVVLLGNYTAGVLLHLNFPGNPPPEVDFLQHFIAPLGSIISLELYNMKLSYTECSNHTGFIEIIDKYSDNNGTTWRLCQDHDFVDHSISSTPIYISSFLNTLHLRQINGPIGVHLNGSLKVQFDHKYKIKLISHREEQVETCSPNPCQNKGKCIVRKMRRFCNCVGHYTGLFCALTKCELDPCAFGTCELTDSSYKCHCNAGYSGPTCDQKRRPCEGNPCESRGTCIERGDSFQCQCHAWWEGQRCEKRMSHIPFKPLTERMLHEPFWLGLMTVFVVMAVIGLVWCAKRHFPEKIEKLLAEEDSRNRSASSLRSSSVREQLAAASGVAVTPSPGPGTTPRSLFGRLGIRKPSILSLTSPHASGYEPATSRTFSLDDLLKPPLRRTPSPKKKRNNSTPMKKNVAEKRQILQQLISPKPDSKKVSLGELIQLSELGKNDKSKNGKEAETKFTDTAHSALFDPKLEKKVTFARLLNKVSAEMSSGSEVELGIMQTNRLGCMFARPASTPPSPSVDIRSPNSTSSNQGSDSFTSSDLAIPSALSTSISDLLINRRNNRLSNGHQKPASADSILAMFRSFSSSSAAANLPSSLRVSPSTTPTASSPQDDVAGDDESSSSSIHTPVSFSSGGPESPISQRHGTIEVPVLDPFSAHKSQPGGSNLLHPPTILLEIPSTINKCLSPIREMPTPLPSPMPSPALTPILRRSTASSSLDDTDLSDDRISVEIPNISLSSDIDDDDIHCTDIAIDPHAEDGLILEEAAAMQHPALFRSKNRPPPLGLTHERKNSSITITIDPPPLEIPTLIIQTPSPTQSKIPSISFPGSPPPHVPKVSNESCFQFPSPKQSRKMLKDFEKPTSLDLPCVPPMITITYNMSEVESDTESISPAIKSSGHLCPSVGMTYLSPFSMNARGEHTASESNLSSSGYSSMASPGPSRCGSSNPLCPGEMDDQGSSGTQRRQSITPVLKSISSPSTSENLEHGGKERRRGRSDSETLSDEPLIESNDEGIGTDHIDEKIDEGALKSAKELEVFMVNENDNFKTILDLPISPMPTTPRVIKCPSLEDPSDRLLPPLVANTKNSLQLPSIVVQCEAPGCDKHLSPMSSRSESPLSDRTTGMGRFSPQFYGRHKDLLPFTDSDGLYDFPSSDKVNIITCSHHKKPGRKRDKRTHRNCKTPSPTKPSQLSLQSHLSHLDIPSKDFLYKVPPPRKLSPKRRLNRSQIVSSSSSSDSITQRDTKYSSSSQSPDTIRWSSPIAWIGEKCSKSAGESCQDIQKIDTPSLAKSVDFSKNHHIGHPKVSRLRTISHQIRFLRRLEQSLKKRDRNLSPSDSDEDSSKVTSPLLQSSKGLQVEIRKSSSIGKLQSGGTKDKYNRGEYVLPQDQSLKVLLAGHGYSD